MWVSVYMGSNATTPYEDRALTMYTMFQYRLTVYNDFSFSISPSSNPVTTFGGIPTSPANISAVVAVNNTAVFVSWTVPGITRCCCAMDFWFEFFP